MKLVAYFAAFFILASSVVALAQEHAPLNQAERARISTLMNRALEAGREEAEAARQNEHLSVDDRRDAQSQFAMILMTMGQCEETVDFVRSHDDVRASGIDRLIMKAGLQGNSDCVPILAQLMFDRTNDTHLTSAGQISIRYRAAAYLDAAGRAGANVAMKTAENELIALPGTSMLWDARFNAIKAYSGTPGYMKYLEYLADRMVAEDLPTFSQDRKNLLVLFAGVGRCDLVEQVVKQGPKSCDEPKRLAEGIYINPRKPDNLDYMLKVLGAMRPPVQEDSFDKAIAKPTPWDRLTALLLLVSACRNALASNTAS